MAGKEHGCEMTDSRIKILISFLLITAMTVMKHWYLPIAISLVCIVFAAKLKVIRDYGKKLIFPLALALFIFLTQSFTNGVNAINLGIFSVYSEGINYGFLIFSRVFASASILLLLAITTSESELLESLRWFRVPKTILEISSFMTRYIITFSNEGEKLRLAQESRCGFSRNLGFKDRMQNIACICGLLITRALAKSDDIYKAMLSRCWKADLTYSMENPFHRGDMIIGAILSSGIIGLVFLDGFL